MPTGRRFCWDSCVFISLLTGENRTPAELANLQALETLCDDGAVHIFTPTITLVEVLACKLTPEQESQFQAVLRRSNVELVSVSLRVAEKAREIRSKYHDSGYKIAVPDSIHLATAIHYGAAALHTFDGCGKGAKKTDLLRLPCPIIGKYDLRICMPEPPPMEPPRKEAEPVGIAPQERNLFEGIEPERNEEDTSGEN